MYKIYHLDDFKQFFTGVTIVNALFNSLMYVFGFYTIFTHRVTNYQIFTLLLMISVFFGILLTYLNVLNILMFILKCVTYVFSRYVLSQLYTVLMVPAAQSLQAQQQRNSIESFNQQLQRQLQEEAGSDSSQAIEANNYVPEALPFDGRAVADVEDRPRPAFF